MRERRRGETNGKGGWGKRKKWHTSLRDNYDIVVAPPHHHCSSLRPLSPPLRCPVRATTLLLEATFSLPITVCSHLH
ncbi:hypothetical protein SESBI_09269 [Sesbania bispinosa]|nr:hypothetical protein SESBI_09269 [Sesbania bispinosa]